MYEYIRILLGARPVLHISRLKVNVILLLLLCCCVLLVDIAIFIFGVRLLLRIFLSTFQSILQSRPYRRSFLRCMRHTVIYISGLLDGLSMRTVHIFGPVYMLEIDSAYW
jgi:hypothetical protein